MHPNSLLAPTRESHCEGIVQGIYQVYQACIYDFLSHAYLDGLHTDRMPLPPAGVGYFCPSDLQGACLGRTSLFYEFNVLDYPEYDDSRNCYEHYGYLVIVVWGIRDVWVLRPGLTVYCYTSTVTSTRRRYKYTVPLTFYRYSPTVTPKS